MILSSRNSPRISLRRAASYHNDKGPLSSTSSRFSFNHLIASPPPSPGLPALIPRHGKPQPARSSRRWLKGAIWATGVLVILYFGFAATHNTPISPIGWATDAGSQYEMVEDSQLPDFPTPVVISDKRGRAKWTVSIPVDHGFPLLPKEYAGICSQNMKVASHVADLHSHMHREHAAHYDYYHVDSNFMDVAEAEEHGLLPGLKGKTMTFNGQDGSVVGENKDGLIEEDVCETSMTFVLETADAGLGKTLMMLWVAYGLADKEGRAFFVDDSRWAYGKWTNFFQPPPKPNCRPPPRHQILPCPRHARHLVVSAATSGHIFGGAFTEHFEDPRKMEVYRQKPIYDLARFGYYNLFRLIPDDEEFVANRVSELQTKVLVEDPSIENGIIVGIHVRHGDRHPLEFQYRDSYIPLEIYADSARDTLNSTFNSSKDSNAISELHSVIVLASDDPDVYDSETFEHFERAQSRIKLASKSSLPSPPEPQNPGPRKFVDESIGWEGGFFSAMFWSLGKPSGSPANAMEKPDTTLPPTDEALRLRELVGRAYLIDLAVLGRSSDRIVCTVSSMGCKLLGVMMGWKKGFEVGGFGNVDGDFEWRGVSW